MTYPPSSSDFPLVRFAGVGVAGLEGQTADPRGWVGDSAPALLSRQGLAVNRSH